MCSQKTDEMCCAKKEKSSKRSNLIPPLNWMLIGNRIREERQRRGISGVELAEIINISASQLSNIEHGKRALCVDIAASAAQALGVSIDYLVRGIRPVIGAGNWGMLLRSDGEIAREIEEKSNDEGDKEE